MPDYLGRYDSAVPPRTNTMLRFNTAGNVGEKEDKGDKGR